MNYLEYGPIHPTMKSGKRVEQLAHERLIDAGHKYPTIISNPRNLSRVAKRYAELLHTPADYLGAYAKDELVGYIQTLPWLIYNDLMYAEDEQYEHLKLLAMTGAYDAAPYRRLGVADMAVDARLPEVVRESVAEHLLESATNNAREMGRSALYIAMSDAESMMPIVQAHDFVFTGRVSRMTTEAAVPWKLYEKPLD